MPNAPGSKNSKFEIRNSKHVRSEAEGFPPLASAGATPAFAGVTSFLRKQELSPRRRGAGLVLRAVVAVVAIVWVFRGQDWGQLGRVFAGLNLWYFVLSLAIYVAGQALIGLRWWLLLRGQAISIGLWTAVKLHFLGLFYNNLMPSSIGGDLLRAWYVAKHTDKKLQAVLSVFVDRGLGFSAMTLIAVFCYLIFLRGQQPRPASPNLEFRISNFEFPAIGGVWLLVGAIVFLSLLLLTRSGRALLGKAWRYVYINGTTLLNRSKDAIIVYCRMPLTILAVLGLTIFLQILVITGFWLIGLNLKIAAGARYYFVFFPIAWVFGALPISIAGIGLLEGGIREMFTRFAGASVEQALALALCQRFIWVLASLPGAVVHLTGAHLPRDFFIDYKQAGD